MKSLLLLAAPLCLAPFARPAFARPAFAQNQMAPTELPLRQVVLFSSGVGYFARAGQIEGNAKVDLTVRRGQVSDLLKSLVIFDEKGKVAPVAYSIEDTVGTRALGTDLNLPAEATPGTILRAFRGATVVLSLRGGDTIEGRIASVSAREVPTDKGSVVVEVANILGAGGLQSVDLNDVQLFRFADAALQAKFVATLEQSAGLLTSQLDDGARSVTLRFEGRGKRPARAGYLLEMPVWKTSYRLVLDDDKKPFLQGWAIVENPTDADWNGVQLSLVAGRPISFVQNLAIPVYVARPVVQTEIRGASFTPQTFGDGLGASVAQLGIVPQRMEENEAFNSPGLQGLPGMMGPQGPPGVPGPQGARSSSPITATPRVASSNFEARSDMAQIADIAAQASAAQAGELFVYALDAPLTLAHGQAAMVPIVSRDVAGETLSIVNARGAGEQVAQNGFRLRNDSDLRLAGGPITVYASGIYGGDARLDGLSPRDSKLIAYGIDLDLVAQRERDLSRTQLLQIFVKDGLLQRRAQSFITQKYIFKNKATKAKTVLIQQPTLGGYELIEPKQRDEKSTEGDRFKVELKAGEAREYEIAWQRTFSETVAIGNFNFELLNVYLRDSVIAPELKAKLEIIAAKRARIDQLEREIDAQKAALEAIDTDQKRLRENMKVLDKEGALFQTYARKLGAQEERIVKIDAEIERLQAAQETARNEFDEAVEKLKG